MTYYELISDQSSSFYCLFFVRCRIWGQVLKSERYHQGLLIVKKSSSCMLLTGSRPVNVAPACLRLTVAGVSLFGVYRLRHDCCLSPPTFVALQGSYNKILLLKFNCRQAVVPVARRLPACNCLLILSVSYLLCQSKTVYSSPML